MADYVDTQVEQILAREDPELLEELKAAHRKVLEQQYPKPEAQDVLMAAERLCDLWSDWEKEAVRIEAERDGALPFDQKWRRHLEIADQNIPRSRLTQNEVLRVASMVTRNWYKVEVPPIAASGGESTAAANAAAQEKWGNAFFPYMERKAQAAMRREVVDAATAYGKGCWELYWTGAYDPYASRLEQGDDESDNRYEQRTAPSLIRAGSPIGIRVANHLATRYDRATTGEVAHAVIIENMNYRQVYRSLAARKSQEDLHELRLPKPGDTSWPGRADSIATAGQANWNPGGDVECITYYDGLWWCYMVGGVLVEKVEEHRFGRNPVFPLEGIVTSGSKMKTKLLGVTSGMGPLEQALDLLMANGIDVSLQFGRPKPAILTDPQGEPIANSDGTSMRNVNLGGPNDALQLNRGQTVVDMFKDFSYRMDEQLIGLFLQMWTKSGRNPIAQGAVPGADAVGYVVNTAIQGTDDLYGVILNGDARVAGDILDTVFHAIKHVVQKPVYMPVVTPGPKPNSRRTEWLGLRPENISGVPTLVTINPTSEQNRMAAAQYWRQGWMDGVVPDEVYIERVYDADDVFAWQKQRMEDDLVRQGKQIIIQDILAEFFGDLAGATQPPPDAGGGGGAAPMLPPGEEPPPGPTVGASLATASRGATRGAVPDLLQQAGAGAGQDNGYRPATPPTQGAPNRG